MITPIAKYKRNQIDLKDIAIASILLSNGGVFIDMNEIIALEPFDWI